MNSPMNLLPPLPQSLAAPEAGESVGAAKLQAHPPLLLSWVLSLLVQADRQGGQSLDGTGEYWLVWCCFCSLRSLTVFVNIRSQLMIAKYGKP